MEIQWPDNQDADSVSPSLIYATDSFHKQQTNVPANQRLHRNRTVLHHFEIKQKLVAID